MELYAYLAHHGVKGQRWHHRQYQNMDGSYTELGREHYGIGKARVKIDKKQVDAYKKRVKKFADNAVNYNVQNVLNSAGKAAMLTASTYCGKFASAYIPSLSASAVSAGKAAIASLMSVGTLPVAAGIAGTAAGYAAYKAIKSHRDKKAMAEKQSKSSHKPSSEEYIRRLDADPNYFKTKDSKGYTTYVNLGSKNALTSLMSVGYSAKEANEILKSSGRYKKRS